MEAGKEYKEYDSWIHPRFRFFLYSGIGFGTAYGFKRLQFRYAKQNHIWMSRFARMAKIGCNCATLAGIGGVYVASILYLSGAEGIFRGSTMLKSVNKLKELDIVDDRAMKRHFGRN